MEKVPRVNEPLLDSGDADTFNEDFRHPELWGTLEFKRTSALLLGLARYAALHEGAKMPDGPGSRWDTFWRRLGFVNGWGGYMAQNGAGGWPGTPDRQGGLLYRDETGVGLSECGRYYAKEMPLQRMIPGLHYLNETRALASF